MGGASKAEQEADQASRSFVDPRQVPFFNQLRQAGTELAGTQIRSIGGVSSQLSGQLGGLGGQLLGGIGEQAGQFAPGALSSISGLLGIAADPLAGQIAQLGTGALPGQAQLEQLAGGGGALSGLTGPGSQLGGQLTALDEAIQRNLQTTLGSIGGQATLAGQTGGDRQAFFSGQAADTAQREFASSASQLLASDLAQRRGLAPVSLGAAQSLQQGALQQGGLLQALLGSQVSGLGTGGALGLAQQGQNIGAAQAGIGALEPLFNLGLAPFAAQFAPLQALSQLIGPPTVLTEGVSRERREAGGFSILNFAGAGSNAQA